MDGLLSFLSPEKQALAQRQAQTQGLIGLGSALLQASQGQPGQRRPTLGMALAQAAPVGMQAYQGGMDQILRDIMLSEQIKESRAKAKQPKFMTIKTPDGGERLVQISPTGAVSPVDIAGLGGGASPKFDAPTAAFLSMKYPGKSYAELNPEQQLEIIEFSNAPDATKAADLDRESKKTRFETGVSIQVPRGRSEFLTPPQVAPPAVAPAPSVAPVSVAPVSDVSVQRVSAVPVSQDLTTQAGQAAALRIPADVAAKPLGEKEKPLIESQSISPKMKQELEVARPKQTQAVEYVLETNTQMLSVIDELLANKGFNDAFGFLGETMSKIPDTNAARVRGLLEKLGGNLFIEAITAMRAASATGAAVGNATEKEGDKLQGSRAALMQAQKAEDARKELEALRDTLRFQRNLVTNAYERTYGRGAFVQREPKKAPEQRKPLQSIFGGQ
jgi:hypothetical protein